VIGYEANHHATSIDDGTNTVAETLSPSGRVLRRRVTDDATAAVLEDTTFGYDGPGDSPAYSKPTAGGAITTYIGGPAGLLVIYVAGTPTYPIQNAHGDNVGTTDANGVFIANPPTDEWGVGTTPANRLGWLGGKERFVADSTLGIMRMGQRLYDPALGRFLEVDPIEGGSCNDYDYVCGDPINNFDLNGTRETACMDSCPQQDRQMNREANADRRASGSSTPPPVAGPPAPKASPTSSAGPSPMPTAQRVVIYAGRVSASFASGFVEGYVQASNYTKWAPIAGAAIGFVACMPWGMSGYCSIVGAGVGAGVALFGPIVWGSYKGIRHARDAGIRY
jgi:RHS repeat-associated protein